MMTAKERGEYAAKFFAVGRRNCAQAVLMAFADELGEDERVLLTAGAPFGGGIGRLGEVCGTVSGLMLVLSFVRRVDTSDPRAKAALYAEERELAEEFRSRAGSIVCRELLAARANKAEGVRGMSCPELVALAAEIAEERIFAPLRSDNDR